MAIKNKLRLPISVLKKVPVMALSVLLITLFSFPTLIHAQTAGIPEVDGNSQAVQALEGSDEPDVENAIAEAVAGGIGTCVISGIFATGIQTGINALVSLVTENLADVLQVPTEDDDNRAVRAKEVSGLQIGNIPILGSWDQMGWCLVNVVIDYIGQSTVAWINSGFQGNPAFVDNPGQFFRDIADIEAGKLIESLGGGFLCEPFRINIQLGLIDQHNCRYGYCERQCTLSDIVENIDSFAQGNFEDGGWEGWFQMTQNPYNNPYGSYYYAERDLQDRIYASQNTVNIDLTWGRGFLSFKDKETGETKTPGSIIDDQINNRLFNGERRLLIADEFDEIINALVNQLVKIALSEVLGGN